jgi:hypothetical protein
MTRLITGIRLIERCIQVYKSPAFRIGHAEAASSRWEVLHRCNPKRCRTSLLV